MEEDPKTQEGAKVARAAGSFSSVTMLSRVFGLVRDAVIAGYFGAGTTTDAFFVAFKVPNLLRRLVAEGSLATAFVPIFTRELHESRDTAKRAVESVTAFTLLITVVLALLGVVFAKEIILLIAPGFEKEAGKAVLSVSLLQIMFPYIVLVSLLALAASILNSLGYFALPAAAPAILNVVLIIGLVLFGGFLAQPIYSLAWAVVVGGCVVLIPQVVLLSKLGFGFGFRNPFKSRAVKQLVTLMIPSILSASVYQIMIFVNNILASMLEDGSVSWLYFAERLFQFPLGVFTIAVATAVLPTFSRFAARNEEAELRDQLLKTLKWVTYVTVAATCGLFMLAEPLTKAIFERGSFSPESTLHTARALCAFSLGLWGISCYSILVRVFLAKQNTKIPALVSVVTILLNVVLALLFIGPAMSQPTSAYGQWIAVVQRSAGVFSLGHIGLALAGSIASYFSLLLLIVFLPRVETVLSLGALVPSTIKTFSSALVMSVVLYGVLLLKLSAIATLIIGVPLGMVVFFASSLLFKSEQGKIAFEAGLNLFRTHFLTKKIS